MTTSDEKQLKANNGPLYLAVDYIVRCLHRISPVEWKKRGVLRIWNGSDSEGTRRIANITIDLFIVLKWLFLLMIWSIGITHWTVVVLSVFLLVMNLHTYFWYHLWAIDMGIAAHGAEFRERRRFVNLVFAIAYSIALYGYLYHRVLFADFNWPQGQSNLASAIVFSVGTALTGSSGDLKPITSIANLTATSQLAMTFIFVAMLLSNSVPRPKA